MHNRFFAGRQILADYFDGVTNYKTAGKNIEKEEEKRREDFGKWIETDQ